MGIMDAKTIAEARELLLVEPAKVKKGALVHEAVQAMLENPFSRKIYVVDDDQKLLGTISYLNLIRASSARFKIRKEGFFPFVRYLKDMFMEDVHELMKKQESVRDNQTLKEALEIMLESQQTDLPVVDSEGRLLGELRGMEIMRLGLEVVKRGDDLQSERLHKKRGEIGIKSVSVDPVTLKPKTDAK